MLWQWGIRSLKMESGGLGYPRVCPMLKEGIPTQARSFEPTGIAPWEMDMLEKAIDQLEWKYKLVLMRSFRPWMARTVEQELEALGTVDRTWRRWLHEAAAILAQKMATRTELCAAELVD